ncbi:hypothetical protein B0J17DRAFT_628535 [Rhizoctonia solani]|nr:hypothetical protein B0J17DRAFT_628535 [Rhizoctonia solani]
MKAVRSMMKERWLAECAAGKHPWRTPYKPIKTYSVAVKQPPPTCSSAASMDSDSEGEVPFAQRSRVSPTTSPPLAHEPSNQHAPVLHYVDVEGRSEIVSRPSYEEESRAGEEWPGSVSMSPVLNFADRNSKDMVADLNTDNLTPVDFTPIDVGPKSVSPLPRQLGYVDDPCSDIDDPEPSRRSPFLSSKGKGKKSKGKVS